MTREGYGTIDPMKKKRWLASSWALTLSVTGLLVACEPETTPIEPVEAGCDPTMDLEVCDGDGRLQCDAVARIWIFIGTCEPMTHCVQTTLEDDASPMTTRCVVEKDL